MSDTASAALHPLAPQHLPGFLPDSTGSDPLTTFVGVFLILVFLAVGTVYFRLHSLPEKLAHGGTQLQLVSVLALLSLVTHNNILWILALLLAAVKLPDYLTPLQNIAESLKKSERPQPEAQTPDPQTSATQSPASSEKEE